MLRTIALSAALLLAAPVTLPQAQKADRPSERPAQGMTDGGMMPMMGMMRQMSEMMEACTQMMKVRMDQTTPERENDRNGQK